MNDSHIKISVIMPIYNSGSFLYTAVDSILNQDLTGFELILVDDGSTDGSSMRCDEYAKNDSRVIVIHQRNGGICNARNSALKIAHGEYIAFSDHDDEFCPEALEHIYKRAKTDDCDILKFCKKEVVINKDTIIRTKKTVLTDGVYNKEEIQENFIQLLNNKVLECVWDGLFRRDFLLKNNLYFDETYTMGGEDIDFLVRAMIHCRTFSTMKELYYMHYIRIGFSTATKFCTKKLETSRLLIERIYNGIKLLGIDIEKHKDEYVYQVMFTRINCSINLLANRLCRIEQREKIAIIKNLRNEPHITTWFFNINASRLFKLSPKTGLSYFLFKHKKYKTMLMMFSFRQKQMELKSIK